jgi:hypothetical protein
MKKTDFLILFVILCLAFALRLYKIDTPLADWHSWRQVDTAAVARNYARTGIDFLHPKFDDLSSIPSGIYNPQGYRFVEFPLYNAAFAALYKYFPVISLVMYGRLVTIAFSLLTIAIVYYLVLKEENRIAASAAALIFSIFPFFVYYSRVVLPEMTALGFVMLSILLLYLWQQSKSTVKKRVLIVSSLACAAISILVKPTAGFYFLPLGFIFLNTFKTRIVRSPMPLIFFVLSIIPLAMWRHWISAFPEGIPGFTWLFTTVNTFEGAKVIFFRPAFFRWIFFERILLLITGGYAIVFLVLGALVKPNKKYFLHSIGLASLIYLFTFQGGNVQHDYYQTMILPSIAIFSGIGISFLIKSEKIFINRGLNFLIVIAIVIFSAGMSYEKVKDYYHTSEDLVQIGNVLQTITPQGSIIVTDRDGDTTLLYLADRKGYPATTEPLDKLKSEHKAEYFVTGKSDVAEQVKKEYDLIFQGDNVFIFKL